MKNNSWLIVGAVMAVLVAIFLISCGKEAVPAPGTTPTASILSGATMTAAIDDNNRPIDPTDVFPIDAEWFLCSVRINNAPPNTELRAEWTYVGGEVEEELGKNYVFDIYYETIEGTGYICLVQPRPFTGYEWPRGDFEIVLYVDDEEILSVPFEVK